MAVDVTDVDAVQEMVDFAISRCGALHLAVNNAGFHGVRATTKDYPIDEWRRVLDVNLDAVFTA